MRIPVAGRTSNSSTESPLIAREVSLPWLYGKAGGSRATRHTREVIAIASVLLPRTQITTTVKLLEA